MTDGEKRGATTGEEKVDEAETVERSKERTSIFKSFVGTDAGSELMETQALDVPVPEPVVKGAVPTTPATVSAQPAGIRKYGQNGIAAMMRKQQAASAAASLLPEKVQGPAKASVEWREPVLDDSDEDDECDGDDEAADDEGDLEEDEEEEEEEEEEEDEEEEEEEEQKPAKKKSLNDVISIKKNTLRLGTVDAGYLRYFVAWHVLGNRLD